MTRRYLPISIVSLVLLGLIAMPACSGTSEDSTQAALDLPVDENGVFEEDFQYSAFEGAIEFQITRARRDLVEE